MLDSVIIKKIDIEFLSNYKVSMSTFQEILFQNSTTEKTKITHTKIGNTEMNMLQDEVNQVISKDLKIDISEAERSDLVIPTT